MIYIISWWALLFIVVKIFTPVKDYTVLAESVSLQGRTNDNMTAFAIFACILQKYHSFYNIIVVARYFEDA